MSVHLCSDNVKGYYQFWQHESNKRVNKIIIFFLTKSKFVLYYCYKRKKGTLAPCVEYIANSLPNIFKIASDH